MHQRRRLQRLPRLLLSQFSGRQPPQLFIHQWQQLLRRRRVAGFDLGEDAGDVGHERDSQERWTPRPIIAASSQNTYRLRRRGRRDS